MRANVMQDTVFNAATAVDLSTTDSTAEYLAIYVGGAGDIKVDTALSTGVTFKAVPVGTVLKVNVTKIYKTGTTATLLLGLN